MKMRGDGKWFGGVLVLIEITRFSVYETLGKKTSGTLFPKKKVMDCWSLVWDLYLGMTGSVSYWFKKVPAACYFRFWLKIVR